MAEYDLHLLQARVGCQSQFRKRPSQVVRRNSAVTDAGVVLDDVVYSVGYQTCEQAQPDRVVKSLSCRS